MGGGPDRGVAFSPSEDASTKASKISCWKHVTPFQEFFLLCWFSSMLVFFYIKCLSQVVVFLRFIADF